jgi:hypothetical protein
MSARLTARKLIAGIGGVDRPILTTAGIDLAVRDLERQYGKGLSGLNAGDMSQRERDISAQAIVRIAQARYRFGLTPFEPIEPGEIFIVDGVPLPYLSDDEILALLAIIRAVSKAEIVGQVSQANHENLSARRHNGTTHSPLGASAPA